MKTVVNKGMVAHLFAHQSQEHARTGSGNFYFDGRHCWSYGSHYCAAVHHGDCVLINSYRYSATTASQLSELRRACRHLDVFEVENPLAESKAEHRANFRAMAREYENEILRVSRARVYTSLDHAERLLANANAYAARFKIGNRLKAIDTTDIKARIADREKRESAARKRESAARKRERDAAEKRRAAEIERNRAEYVERLAKWRAGWASCYDLGSYRNSDTARLRLTSDGETVQTSQGAEFPAQDAREAIGFVLRCFETRRDWQRTVERVPLGQFQLDAISGTLGLLRAGCHTVTANEVLRLAALLHAAERMPKTTRTRVF